MNHTCTTLIIQIVESKPGHTLLSEYCLISVRAHIQTTKLQFAGSTGIALHRNVSSSTPYQSRGSPANDLAAWLKGPLSSKSLSFSKPGNGGYIYKSDYVTKSQ